jgi:hypothetical protein
MRAKPTAVTAAAAVLIFSTLLQANSQQSKVAPPVERNAFGQPDLSGDWSNASITPLTRNRSISDKPTLSLDEATSLEGEWAKALAADDQQLSPDATVKEATDKFRNSKIVQFRPDLVSPASGGAVGGYNTFWIDPGSHLVEINGEYRTSIVTTPDGQVPRRKPGAPPVKPSTAPSSYDSYENRPLGERCLAFAGRNAGPPMLSNGYYNNNYQILQTKDQVVILVEILHDVRIVRLNSEHRTDGVRPSMGDSIGHYEGDTLVIETTNFPERENFMGSWRNLKVTEWMTRVSPGKIVYRFQVADSDSWDKPWGGEGVFNALKPGSVFEYACHEGNYALKNVLAGARMAERTATKPVDAATPAPARATH